MLLRADSSGYLWFPQDEMPHWFAQDLLSSRVLTVPGQKVSSIPPPKLRMFSPGAGVVFTGTLSAVTGS